MKIVNHAASYYSFIKWFKDTHAFLYSRYGMFIKISEADWRIAVALDYIDPEHKAEMLNLIGAYNNDTLN